jgi:hypothetical protein
MCTTEIEVAVMRKTESIWHQDTATRAAMQDSELFYFNSDVISSIANSSQYNYMHHSYARSYLAKPQTELYANSTAQGHLCIKL